MDIRFDNLFFQFHKINNGLILQNICWVFGTVIKVDQTGQMNMEYKKN